jgi:ferritin-like protein
MKMALLQNPLGRANQEIQNRSGNKDEIYYTLEYLVNIKKAIGYNLKNKFTQNDIVDYINKQMNSQLSLSNWQNNALQDLKKKLIVVTVVSPGATFIPNDTNDLKIAMNSLEVRIQSEQCKLQNYKDIFNGK